MRNIILLSIFFVVNEILCNYYIELELINSYDNTPYNKYAIFMNMSSGKDDFIDLSGLMDNEDLQGCVLLKYNENNGPFNEVLYCDENAVDIAKGEQSNFDFKKRFAVVGCESGYNYGDFIHVEGNEYIVQGILCKHICNTINKGVFYCDGNISKLSTQNAYVLASKNERFVTSAYKRIEEFLRKNNAEVKRLDISRARFSDYIRYTKIMNGIILILFLFYIALFFAIKHIWLKPHYSEILILIILGHINVENRVKMEYILMWVSAYSLSLILFWAFYYQVCRDILRVVVVATVILLLGLLPCVNMFNEDKFLMKYNMEGV